MSHQRNRARDEERFRGIFADLGVVTAYARRRGSSDPDAIAAEVMAIAWRRLDRVPADDSRPWLFATARNLLLAEWRQRAGSDGAAGSQAFAPPAAGDGGGELDPQLMAALRSLSDRDREALLLVAWEDLSPKLAAEALGIGHGAFRVRLHRARSRVRRSLLAGADTARDVVPELMRLEKR